tara:strand:- start:146 stop:424 length:279 start_codon:yes stop_codon:yes gene_type:complete
MINYLVIGICLALLFAVIYISAKPISMGIEARRNIKDKEDINEDETDSNKNEVNGETNVKNISDEIIKLNKLMDDGILTEEEYKKAKKKILS